MAFPDFAVLVDDMNRTNENPNSFGGKWRRSGPDADEGGQIVSNVWTGTGSSYWGEYWTGGGVGLGDYSDVEAAIKISHFASGDIQLFARMLDIGGSAYAISSYPNNGGYFVNISPSLNLRLNSRSRDGLATDVVLAGPVDVSAGLGDGDMLGISCIGNTIAAYLKNGAGAWVQKASVTNNDHQHGAVGTSIETTATTIDDFWLGGVLLAAAPYDISHRPHTRFGPF